MATFLVASYPRPVGEAFRLHEEIGKSRIQERVRSLNTRARQALSDLPHVRLHTPMSPRLSAGIICFEVDGHTPVEAIGVAWNGSHGDVIVENLAGVVESGRTAANSESGEIT